MIISDFELTDYTNEYMKEIGFIISETIKGTVYIEVDKQTGNHNAWMFLLYKDSAYESEVEIDLNQSYYKIVLQALKATQAIYDGLIDLKIEEVEKEYGE